MADLNDVLLMCAETQEKLNEVTDTEGRRKVIVDHIDIINKKLSFQLPDFQKGLEWLNTSSPLSFHDNLKGKIVVLDFFTYCCINCMHVLPDLEALEKHYKVADGVVVLGVHSAKFENEKISANILSAILRYNISHPVVNDDSATLWQTLMISCWPSFVVIGPSGQYLYSFVGEGHKNALIEFVNVSLEYFKDEIKDHSLPVKLEWDNLPPTPLYFPGKVCGSMDGKTIIISDTGHNRILVLGKDGIVKYCIGGNERGFKDGSFEEVRFNSPQGVTILDDTVFVADTDNHAIRKIYMKSRMVSTIVGTGKQGHDKEGGKFGLDQEISSPWDLALGGASNEILFIAMAGTHQIWAYFLQDCTWLRGTEFKAGICVRVAGSGNEENRNNSYPDKAAFAQPSGLALSSHLDMLYIADSESSSVRQMSLKDGAVKGLVGGERDPMNLFAYGDNDGIGIEAKLQHPLAVALVTENSGPLLIADSYNHKIKSVDLSTKMCTTIAGVGNKDLDCINVHLNEPGGLWVDQVSGLVYIADTNNHSIKIMNLQDKTIKDLNVILPDESSKTSTGETNISLNKESNAITNTAISAVPGNMMEVMLYLNLPVGTHLTEDAPSTWIINLKDEEEKDLFCSKGWIGNGTMQTIEEFCIPDSHGKIKLYLKCRVMYCDMNSLCHMVSKTYLQEIIISDSLEETTYKVKFDVNI